MHESKRNPSFRDVFQPSDPASGDCARVLGLLVKCGAMSQESSLSARGKFITWRMESEDVVRIRDAWERGDIKTEEMYVVKLSLLASRLCRCYSSVQRCCRRLHRLRSVVKTRVLQMFLRQGQHLGSILEMPSHSRILSVLKLAPLHLSTLPL